MIDHNRTVSSVNIGRLSGEISSRGRGHAVLALSDAGGVNPRIYAGYPSPRRPPGWAVNGN